MFQIATTTTNELAVNSSVYLSLQRNHGTFDTITVSYEVSTIITRNYVLMTSERHIKLFINRGYSIFYEKKFSN